ncbi:MAG: VWA domain-containing protein [Solobacterium sp.]|nr:VWA domain-containing protein [Solobacterium sp.]
MKKIKIFILCSLLFLSQLAFMTSVQAKGSDENDKSRIIYVVYDDSQSMADDHGNPDDPGEMLLRWSQAKYAMEVFTAMMDEKDIMRIYPMSDYGDKYIELKGSDSKRVETVHNWTTNYNTTPFSTVEKAAEALGGASGNADKWLLVLTDGVLRDGDGSGRANPVDVQGGLQSFIDRYKIKVGYLAIGNEGTEIMPANGLYPAKAADDADSILENVTKLANTIFVHMDLPASHIRENGAMKELSIDIPTDHIIVFAQGSDADIKTVTMNGEAVDFKKTVVKFSDVKPKNYNNAKADESLRGIIAEIVPSKNSDSIPKGHFNFEVTGSNIKNIQYNISPAVQVTFFIDGKPATDANLKAGEHTVTLGFIDPVNNSTVVSDLLDSADIDMSVMVNGETVASFSGKAGESSEKTFVLEEGDIEIEVVAEMPGNIHLEEHREYRVVPKPIDLKVEIVEKPEVYAPDRINENSDPVVIRVSNPDGTELSDSQIKAIEKDLEKNIQVTSTQQGDITFLKKKTDQRGVYDLIPVPVSDSFEKLAKGSSTNWTVTVGYVDDLQTAEGYTNFTLTIKEYIASRLEIRGSQNGEIRLKTLSGNVDVEVYYEDLSTGEMKPLTDEMWEKLRLKHQTIKSDGNPGRLDWSISKGSSPGTYTMKPKHFVSIIPCFWLLDWLLASGDVTLRLNGSVASGEYLYSGTGEIPVSIVPLSWLDILIALLIMLAIAFIVCGYLFKKKIPYGITHPASKLYPVCIDNTRTDTEGNWATSPKKTISKGFLSVVIPWVPQRATVYSSDPHYHCRSGNLEIEAMSGKSFRILSNHNLARTRFNGQQYRNMADVKAVRFRYGNFKMATRDEDDLTIGVFQFTKPAWQRRRRRR